MSTAHTGLRFYVTSGGVYDITGGSTPAESMPCLGIKLTVRLDRMFQRSPRI